MDLLRSLPLGLYLEQPMTWLHRLDPRVKLAWLMTFLITPLLANLTWRIGIVIFLGVLTGFSANSVARPQTANGLDPRFLPPHFGHHCGDAGWDGNSIAASNARQ
jgi:Cobalt transport protein